MNLKDLGEFQRLTVNELYTFHKQENAHGQRLNQIGFEDALRALNKNNRRFRDEIEHEKS